MPSLDPAAAALRKRSGSHTPSLHLFDFQFRQPLGARLLHQREGSLSIRFLIVS
jgi:hypothetical protein